MDDPRADYQARLGAWRSRIAALDAAHLRISNGRLIVAGIGAVLFYLSFFRGTLSPLWPGGALVGFLALVVLHARLLQRRERARRAESWYLRGLDRLDGRWAGRGRNGSRFLAGHDYARDLDLFGPGSLFELTNVTTTEVGEDTLAAWLAGPAAVGEIRSRQAAIDELRGKGAFREDIAVLAAESEVSRTGSIGAWAAAPPAGLEPALGWIFAGCAAITVLLTALVIAERVPSTWLLFWFCLEAIPPLMRRRQLHFALARVGSVDRDLGLLTDLLTRIEAEPLAAPRLKAIAAALYTDGVPPSKRIAQLRRMVGWLDSTRNQLVAPIAAALLVPQQLAVLIDRWHTAHGRQLGGWLKALGELEALAALSTYAFEHPRDPFPAIAEDGPLFDARALGHPLMLETAAVPNDLRLGGDGPRLIVISGSNMSGKSTLLRSAGVNAVLALAGAPVRAASLTLSPLVLGATLKVEDSLQEGHSRFYAEILRIKTIVDAARGPVPLLFLLDEILHGTNSHDRRIGAEAIVRALVTFGAIGLVTTHDLSLTELPPQLGGQAINMHFEDRLEAGKMVFDYRIRAGVVEHSNALALMRAVGLDV